MKKFTFILAMLAFVFLASAAVRYRVYSNGDINIQTGRGVTTADGTVTNTFTVAFGAVPKVVTTIFGTTLNSTNNVRSVTTSNFIFYGQITGVTNDYIAIGTP